MPQSKFDEKRLLLVAAAVAFAGLFAVLLKKLLSLPDKTDPELKGRKKHCYLALSRQTIQRYLDSGAKRMEFEFVEEKNRVKLYLLGYDAADDACFRKKIKTPHGPETDVDLENKEFGPFEREHARTWLHETLTKEPIQDWEFKPVECELPNGKGYVSYEMTASSLQVAIRVNPCPPGCH
jgi:hypothetical protein